MRMANIQKIGCLLLTFLMVYGAASELRGDASAIIVSDLEQVVERAEQAGLSIQQIEKLIQRARQEGLEDEQITNLILPAAELAEQNLPGTLVLKKAFEGLAKDVPANRIEPVIIDLKSRIQKAKDVVEPWMEDKEDSEKSFITENGQKRSFRYLMIEATAQALSGSVPAERITAFLDYVDNNVSNNRRHSRSLTAAVHVLSDLITSEEHPELSNQMLVNAVNAGFSASELHQLPQALKLAHENSRLPAKAVANGFTRQVNDGLSATRIIQNLQIGTVEGGDMPPRMDQPVGPDQTEAADKHKKNGQK